VTARRIASAVAALLAAAPAAAYVRTTAAGTGNGLAWPAPAVPWHLNRDWPNTAPSCEATAAGDPTLDAVRASFGQWEQSCANLRLVYGGTTGDIRTGVGGPAENIVVFRRGWCSQHPQAQNDPCFDSADGCSGIYDCFDDPCNAGVLTCAGWATVALTSVIYDPETGRIIDADIEVNGWDGMGDTIGSLPRHGWYFTCYDAPQPGSTCTTYDQADCLGMDLRNTVTHEVGHFIGLAHTPNHLGGDPMDRWPTMEATTTIGDLEKRSLAADDVAGVCAIYEQPSGGCGCASGAGGGMLALLLAGLALRRRRPQTTSTPAYPTTCRVSPLRSPELP
jgi:MYXO-CTERM domain-containing protein